MTMHTLTLTYGDPDEAIRDRIGDRLIQVLSVYSLPILCDRFTGIGQWTEDDGTTYSEHSGVILVDIGALSSADLQELESRVRLVARLYDQDAIGFGHAPDSKLVG